eukprot:scaffold186890_cov30-Tisochrysis_lutea.AAC.4
MRAVKHAPFGSAGGRPAAVRTRPDWSACDRPSARDASAHRAGGAACRPRDSLRQSPAWVGAGAQGARPTSRRQRRV